MATIVSDSTTESNKKSLWFFRHFEKGEKCKVCKFVLFNNQRINFGLNTKVQFQNIFLHIILCQKKKMPNGDL